MPLEDNYDAAFVAALALQEKQIQQNYRPVIGVHKWFARRPGTLFRNLLLAEYNGAVPLRDSYYSDHRLQGVIADPFMGGGTPVVEANRLGFSVIGTDVNPMAYWIVRQELSPIDDARLVAAAEEVIDDVAAQVGHLYRTTCTICGRDADVKYYLWVKLASCPQCGEQTPLFPGYLLAEAVRHPSGSSPALAACSSSSSMSVRRRTARSPAPTAADLWEEPVRRVVATCRAPGAVTTSPTLRPAPLRLRT